MIWLFACTKGSVEVPDQTDDSTPAVVDSEIEDTGCLHTTYFPDEDGDGYGDEDLPTESCEPIIGAVIAMTPTPSGNCIGNGSGQILYSSAALQQSASVAVGGEGAMAVTSWLE